MIRQFLSYAVVGALTNLSAYALYLLLTHLWGAPKLTMTLLYSLGAVGGFLANRRYTFRHDGHPGKAGVRYLLVQFSGYLLNLISLALFADWLGFAHQYVQAVALVAIAVYLFVLSRIFVFAHDRARGE
jgi:putative flippase GtrA